MVDAMVYVSKDTIFYFKLCLQNVHENIDFLQLESQLQQEELQQRSHHSELVSV